MKRILSVLLLAPCMVAAQETVDGPYVFYQRDSALIRTISQHEDLAKPETKTVSKADLTASPLEIKVPGHPDWNFSVSVKSNIAVPPDSWPMPDKMLVLSDIEGEFAAGRGLLIAAKVIDEHYNWIFGTGHLVVAGDLFDRGTEVLPWLWLLYNLEDKAAVAGGRVQVVLGNHDVMQLSGDYRYTDAKYFKHAWLMGRDIRNVFGDDTELGRWLRSRNVIERTGDMLFMHAGISPEILKKGMGITAINNVCRPFYGANRKDRPDSVKSFFDSNSPFWYRGYFSNPKAPESQIDSTLQLFGCKTIVVGHTITDTSLVSLYGGKVIGVDVNEHEGHHAALLVENGVLYQVDDKGSKTPLKAKE